MQLGGWSTNQSTNRPQQSFPLHPAASTCSDPQPCMSAGPASCGGSAPMPITSLVCQLSARRAGPAASVASSYALVTGGSPGARSQVSQSTDDTGGHIFGGGHRDDGQQPGVECYIALCYVTSITVIHASVLSVAAEVCRGDNMWKGRWHTPYSITIHGSCSTALGFFPKP